MKLFSICLFLLISSSVFPANYPFPQNVKYVYGIKPGSAKHSDALTSYNNYKNNYLREAPSGMKRVLFSDGYSTVSEGIAYGMLLAVYANDQSSFDGLWRYYKYYMNSRGVMHWKINGDGTISGYNGATDAEEDAAMALIVADNQWESGGSINYLSDAITLINNIMQYEVEKPSYVLKPGDSWGGSDHTNPSYFAPAYYRIFYLITGDSQWLNVIDKSYDILSKNAHPTTGLVSDWCNASGAPKNNSVYYYDATRFPWRMANDYLWFGTTQAKDYCVKIANFIKNSGGTYAIGDRYALNGTKLSSFHNNSFVGTFALASMADASFQGQLNDSYLDNVKTYPDGYFSQMLQSISLFMLTGNFYRMPLPVCNSPDLGSDKSLCDAPSYVLSTGLSSTNRNFLWSTGETTPTITTDKKGVYIVRVDSAGCLRSDTVLLLGLDVNLGSDRDIRLEEPYVLDAASSGPGVSYLWSTGEITQTIIIDSAGLYWVQVDSAGCSDRDTVILSYEDTDKIKASPNPTTGKVNILLLDAYAEKAEVEIFTPKGQKAARMEFIIERGDPIVLDLSPYSQGTYYIRVKTIKAVKVVKVYKE